MINVTFNQLNGETLLPDGDKIAVQVTANACDPANIRIGLQLGPNITWWKGIQLDDIVLVQCQDSQNYAITQIAYTEFKAHSLILWKAKVFGVHDPMYQVTDALQNLTPGNQYLFEWLQDN